MIQKPDSYWFQPLALPKTSFILWTLFINLGVDEDMGKGLWEQDLGGGRIPESHREGRSADVQGSVAQLLWVITKLSLRWRDTSKF